MTTQKRRWPALVLALCMVLSLFPVGAMAEPATGVDIEEDNITLTVGESIKLNASVMPDGADYQSMEWWSDYGNVSVSQDGTITGQSGGYDYVYVRIYSEEYGEYTDVCYVDILPRLESISLAPDTYTFSATGSERYVQLSCMSDNDAAVPALTWSSSNPSVASVDQNGKVTRGSELGSTTITATAVTGDGRTLTASCEVWHAITVDSVTLSKTNLKLHAGDTEKLSATVKPNNATDKRVEWSFHSYESNDEVIATVAQDGTVTAVNPGRGYVSVNAVTGGASASCEVSVLDTPIFVSFENSTATVSRDWEMDYIPFRYGPGYGDIDEIEWTISDPTVFDFGYADGSEGSGYLYLKPKGPGTATVTAKIKGAEQDTCTVTSTAQALTGINLSTTQHTFYQGSDDTSFNLGWDPEPWEAARPSVRYESSVPDVASVDENGKVTMGSKTGETTITVATEDGNISADCVVKNVIRADGIDIQEDSITLTVGDTVKLHAKLSPEEATETIRWRSEGSETYDDLSGEYYYGSVSVDSDGTVTAESAGECTVYASVGEMDDYSDYCSITIVPKLVNIEVGSYSYDEMDPAMGQVFNDFSSYTFYNGQGDDSFQLPVCPVPMNAKLPASLTYKSSDPDVASVDASGKVTRGSKFGETTITVSNEDGTMSDTCVVKNVIPVTGISLDKDSITLVVGSTVKLNATVSPESATSDKTVSWRYESAWGENISIDQDGTVTASGTGEGTIYASVPNPTWVEPEGYAYDPEVENERYYTASCSVYVGEELTGINLHETEHTFYQGYSESSFHLDWDPEPMDAAYGSVRYSSSDDSVASVDQNGTVTMGDKTGEATITVTVDGFTATCLVKNVIPANGLTIEEDSITLTAGETYKLTAVVYPEGAVQDVNWVTEEDWNGCISLDHNGTITALGEGSCRVRASVYSDYTGEYSDDCWVYVNSKLEGIRLGYSDYYDEWGNWYDFYDLTSYTFDQSKSGNSFQLDVSPDPMEAKLPSALKYESSDPDVASVDEKGTVTQGTKLGETTITVSSEDGSMSDTCVIKSIIPVTEIVIVPNVNISLISGQTKKLSAKVFPEDATNKTVTWRSDDESVVTVSKDGTITAKREGGTWIHADTEYGGGASEVYVQVVPPVKTIRVDQTSVTTYERADYYETLYVSVYAEPSESIGALDVVSSDTNVLEIEYDQCGWIYLHPRTAGKATITITDPTGEITKTVSVTVKPVEVNGVSINGDSSRILRVGKSTTLNADISPWNATNQKLTWEATNERVVTLTPGTDTNSCTVTAVTEGKTTIIVTTDDGGFTANVDITVTETPNGIRLYTEEMHLDKPGDKGWISYEVVAGEGEDQEVTWTSYNSSVASVDRNGEVTAKRIGTTVIAGTIAGARDPVTCTVTVGNADDVDEIWVAHMPNTTQIPQYSSLDLNGLVIMARWSDGTESEITDYDLSGFDVTIPGQKTVTVNYNGKTTTFDVTITAGVERLTVEKKPTKISYLVGEDLDLKGIELAVIYSDGTKGKLTYEDYQKGIFTVDGYSKRRPGIQSLVVTYLGAVAGFDITMRSEAIEEISVPSIMIDSHFFGGKNISLVCRTAGAEVYYTTNGDIPTEQSIHYNGPFPVTRTTMIKAVAVKNGVKSEVSAGRILVTETGAVDASYPNGTSLAPGSFVTFSSRSGNADIYYTFDTDQNKLPDQLYTGALEITENSVIRVMARKVGYRDSGVMSFTYQVDGDNASEEATISVGSVQAKAGENVSVPVVLMAPGAQTINSFRFTVAYDPSLFGNPVVAFSKDLGFTPYLSVDEAGGRITLAASDLNFSGGQLCTLNLTASANAGEGEYGVTIDAGDVSVSTQENPTPGIVFLSGTVYLSASLTGSVDFVNTTGEDITSAEELNNTDTEEINTSIVLDEDIVDSQEPVTATMFAAFYNRAGMLIGIQNWEVDLSDLSSIVFMQKIEIPKGVEIGSLKLMLLSDQFVPMMAATQL